MAQERVVGFVVGSDTSQGREVWKVRVQKTKEKLVVASVHDNIALAPGLNVSFLIGIFKERGQDVRKAVDVRILSETQGELKMDIRPSDYDSVSLVVIQEEDGSRYVWLTSHESEQEAREWSDGMGGDFIQFSRFDIQDYEGRILDFDNAVAGFHAINAISCIGGIDRALEQFLTLAYNLGCNSRKEN
jgi:ribosomal protein L34